ncbi:MAG: SDR family oxidoreductase [Coriobacteriia bacterium]|nr:SDR family oxidoreductase [Coriobacteriia bacterium]MCL2750235.1 SDR family oxidoreductase [Coriobacteriia bacterium]
MDNFKSVEGKVALVIGATSGIGEAIVKTFAQNGMKVVFSGRREDKGQALADELTAEGCAATFVKADANNEAEVEALVQATVDKFGKLNVLCNNAGRTYPNKPVHEYTSEDFDALSDLHYKAVFLGTKYAVKAMIDTDSRGCTIINTVSGSGLRGTEGLSLYTSSKHAAMGLTKVAALDYARHDITVNAICPGVIDTEIFAGVPAETMAVYNAMMPLGRIGKAEEVAWLALFLASDMARFITGAAITIDAGLWAGDQNPALVWETPDTREF